MEKKKERERLMAVFFCSFPKREEGEERELETFFWVPLEAPSPPRGSNDQSETREQVQKSACPLLHYIAWSGDRTLIELTGGWGKGTTKERKKKRELTKKRKENVYNTKCLILGKTR